jgi:hypothetical protein
VQRQRPAIRDEAELEEEDRPRRRRREETGSSGKATASLILGIFSLCGCACLTGLPAILFGILSLRDIGRAAGVMSGKPMAIIGILLGSLGTLCWPLGGIPSYLAVQRSAEKATATNSMKQLAIAMHNYHDTYGTYPPQGLSDPRQPPGMGGNPKPLLSWRVALLPFVEEDVLYRQFKLDEPWDGPNNIKLLARMPKIYKLPGDKTTPSDHTVFQVFSGPGAMFEPGQRLRIVDVMDGTSNTIMIAEAAKGVPWTKPEDIPFNPNQPVAPLVGGHYGSVFLVAMGDGMVRWLPQNTPEAALKAAITRNGAEVIPLP